MSYSANERFAEVSGTAELSERAWHQLLSAEERRILLDVLTDATRPIDLMEIATEVTRHKENSNAVDEETVERVAASLHHHHLPKMANFGVLEYDSSTHHIEGPD